MDISSGSGRIVAVLPSALSRSSVRSQQIFFSFFLYINSI